MEGERRALRTTRVLCAALVWLGGAYAAAKAEEPGPECASATSNVEIKACLAKAYERADKELNAVWKQVMANVNDADTLPAKERKAWKDELLESQRAWIQFKEHDYDAVGYEWWGGSGAGGAVSSCLLDHTVARTKDLRQRYLDR
jgi:uncharacterized protein YecT (DUF1311 family)